MLLALFLLQLPNPSAAAPNPDAISSERLGNTLRAVCSQERLAGTKESQKAADYVASLFSEAGLEVERPTYSVYLPRQTAEGLWLIQENGRHLPLDLEEHGFPQDSQSQHGTVPPMHGSTGAGNVRGRVVFAGFGRVEDFQSLKEQGVRTDGTIALIRYGKLFRGQKVQNAEAAGCVGALLYTDSEDDGNWKGKTLPQGPWRPSDGIQRGSVFNGHGDPLTPGWASVSGAKRIPIQNAKGLSGIPSLPISQANATALFGQVARPEKPGALKTRCAMKVEQNPNLVQITNVIGKIEGATHPEDWVIVGAHRDSWGFGAVDNGTGITVLLETARVLGEALNTGWRPDRTIILATWDAEEWGLVGSTEWVEENRKRLKIHGVAYINMDVAASGPNLGASGTPGLVDVFKEACRLEGQAAPETLGTPGGGSDHIPFLELAGMEVLGFGFHGGSGSYHSAYDTPWLVEQYLDPGFKHHESATRLLLRILLQLARSETRVDGILGWTKLAFKESKLLKLDERNSSTLVNSIYRASVAATDASPPHPHRYLRFFLPNNEHGANILWQSSGYSGNWFPNIKKALKEGNSPTAAVNQVVRTMDLVTTILSPDELKE
ncbi:MAG: M28 family peptidase [Planctomycetota bacterium]|jgi:N-acetylated-alpha-linked acidic dipeptidase|nr:M28 family peptidase [Planctomycetota bacterium]MDP6941480.1 M28 family peptidase [Planctomycetota bacterium]